MESQTKRDEQIEINEENKEKNEEEMNEELNELERIQWHQKFVLQLKRLPFLHLSLFALFFLSCSEC
jgi:hypothetical protein